MKNNLIVTIVVVFIIASGGGFFAGIKYQQSKSPSFPGNFEGIRQQIGDRTGSPRIYTNNIGFGAIRGEILSVDDGSITVKLADNSSKIIILGDNTQINKTEAGSTDDFSTGTQVTIFGQTNEDGSITADNIQIGNIGDGMRPVDNNN